MPVGSVGDQVEADPALEPFDRGVQEGGGLVVGVPLHGHLALDSVDRREGAEEQRETVRERRWAELLVQDERLDSAGVDDELRWALDRST